MAGIDVGARGWRLKAAVGRERVALSIWQRRCLWAGAGYWVVPGGLHLFADWRGDTWTYFPGIDPLPSSARRGLAVLALLAKPLRRHRR